MYSVPESVTLQNRNSFLTPPDSLTARAISGHMVMEFEEYIADSLEKYGGILIHKVVLHVQAWS